MKRYFYWSFAICYLFIAVNFCGAVWVVRRPMRFARYGAMVAAVNNRLYVIGGLINQNTAVASVEEYNPVLDTWITKSPMPTPRAFGVCGVVNGKIYVLGGVRTRNAPIETCEVYDPVQNHWQRIKKIPTRRHGYNGGVIGGNVYVAGGYFPGQMLYADTLEGYNTFGDSWFIRGSMNFPRADFGAAVVNNRLYAIGGYAYSYQDKNEEYNPSNDTWRLRAPLPIARSGLVCATIGDKIYAIGGQKQMPREIFARVDFYNVLADSWRLAESLNVARYYAGAATINNRIYAVGGLDWNNNPIPSLEEYIPPNAVEQQEESAVISPGLIISPNPFRYSTGLQYSTLPGQSIIIKIYDNSGHLVKTLSATNKTGYVIWDGTDDSRRRLPSGVYFAKVNQKTKLIKLVMLR